METRNQRWPIFQSIYHNLLSGYQYSCPFHMQNRLISPKLWHYDIGVKSAIHHLNQVQGEMRVPLSQMQFLKHDFSLMKHFELKRQVICPVSSVSYLFNRSPLTGVIHMYEIHKKSLPVLKTDGVWQETHNSCSPTASLKSAWAHTTTSLCEAKSCSLRVRLLPVVQASRFLVLHSETPLLFLYNGPMFAAE